MRYLLILCFIGMTISAWCVLEQVVRYAAADHGSKAALFLKDLNDPSERRLSEWIPDTKVVELVRIKLAGEREINRQLLTNLEEIASSIKSKAIRDIVFWVLQGSLWFLIIIGLNRVRREQAALGAT